MKRQLTWLTWPKLSTLTNELLFFPRHLILSSSSKNNRMLNDLPGLTNKMGSVPDAGQIY